MACAKLHPVKPGSPEVKVDTISGIVSKSKLTLAKNESYASELMEAELEANSAYMIKNKFPDPEKGVYAPLMHHSSRRAGWLRGLMGHFSQRFGSRH
jgi:hypothetical protein